MSLSAGLQLNSNWWQANAHRHSATTSQLSTSGEDCTVSHVGSRTFLPLPVSPIRDCIRTNDCTSFTVHPHYLHPWREEIFTQRKRCETQVTAEFLPLSVVSLFQTWHAEPKDWIVARSPFIFLSSFHFFPLLPLWTEVRVHLGLLYCATGKLPIWAIPWTVEAGVL